MKGAVNGSRDLVARAGVNRVAESSAPALRSRCRLLEPKIGQNRSLIDVGGDLFSTALSGDVLRADQRRAATVAGETDEVLGDQGHRSPRTLLPWGVRSRVDDDLTHHSPSGVVRVAACDEKPCERLGHPDRSWLAAVLVEMSQCRAHLTAVIDRSSELTSGPSRLAGFLVHPSTVLDRGGHSSTPRQRYGATGLRTQGSAGMPPALRAVPSCSSARIASELTGLE